MDIKNMDIKILTWNLCWGCTSNNTQDSTGKAVVEKCIEKTLAGQPPIEYACFKNIKDTIDKTLEDDIDIYAFQEAMHIDDQNFFMDKILGNKYIRTTTNHPAKLTTYSNQYKYNVVYITEGVFDDNGKPDNGRPFHIVLLCNKVTNKCFYFINGHIGHNTDSNSVNKVLTKAFKDNKCNESYEIIMAGDTNDHGYKQYWNNTYINGKKVYASNKPPGTCCIGDNKKPQHSMYGDYVMSSSGATNKILFKNDPINSLTRSDYWTSDHLPVLGTVKDSEASTGLPPPVKLFVGDSKKQSVACPLCNYDNDKDEMFCSVCDTPLHDGIVCPVCTFINDKTAKKCIVCNTPLPSVKQPVSPVKVQVDVGLASAGEPEIQDDLIHVKIIRHAHSIANEYKDTYKQMAVEETFRDPKLSIKGIESIKPRCLQHVLGSNPDLIICSPLLRAIETLSRIYDDKKFQNRVKICPLVCEIGNFMENRGSSRDKTKVTIGQLNIPDIGIDFDDLKYYDYGWKKEVKDHKTGEIKMQDAWKELEGDVLRNIGNARFETFHNFLRDKQVINSKIHKNIVIVSHSQFIHELYIYICNICKKIPIKLHVNNLDGISFTFNTKTGHFSNVDKIFHKQDNIFEKYLKYKNKYIELKNSMKMV
jgi:broad specificity phosphatase PhoE